MLNDKATSISGDTQQRVLDAAQSLGYRPNALAKSLRSNRSGTIGFVSRDIVTTPYAGALIHGAQAIAEKHDHVLLLANTSDDPGSERQAVQTLLDRRIDAAIFATMYHQVIDPPAELTGTPFVVLNSRPTGESDHCWVAPDETGAARAVIAHLIDAGHRRIGYIDAADNPPAAVERRAGYYQELETRGLKPCPPHGPIVASTDTAGGVAAATEILTRADRPTAVFCFNDLLATGVYIAARRLGLSIPRDLSIVGFDNQVLVAESIDPGLTTVQLPHEEMGRWAMEQVLRLLDGEHGAQSKRMPCPLVERGSVAPPSQQ